MSGQGWIGLKGQLDHVLATFHCDRDPDGKFLVGGSISSFMGAGEEFVVGADAVYFVDGKPHNLCAALGATSYGVKVLVI